MSQYQDILARRREYLLGRMDVALSRSGRSLDDARLLAVSKTVDVDAVVDAIAVGYRLFGENRPQELNRKLEGLSVASRCHEIDLDAIQMHMIGNLQTNKINSLVGKTPLIHSISSSKLAQEVSARTLRAQQALDTQTVITPQSVLLEVNVSGEQTKQGFTVEEVERDYAQLCKLEGIKICGLMCMAPAGKPKEAHRAFAGLRELKDRLNAAAHNNALSELSMGMSGDFEIALEEGSTCIRLGRIVFDPNFAVE